MTAQHNQFGLETAKALGAALKTNTTLQTLKMFGNPLPTLGVVQILIGMKRHPSLSSVDLRSTTNSEKKNKNVVAAASDTLLYGSSSFQWE